MAWLTTSGRRGTTMALTFGDICLAMIAIAAWLIFLFGTGTVG